MPPSAMSASSQALFFGLKAAVLAIVLQAVMRIGRRALKNRRDGRHRRRRLRRDLLLRRAVPADRPRRRRRRLSAAAAPASGHFSPAAGTARRRRPVVADADTALGEETAGTCTAGASPGRCSVAAICLVLWLGPVAAPAADSAGRATVQPDRHVLPKMAVVTFGGAYAVLAYVAQQAVETLSAGCSPARCWTAWAWPRPRPGR